MKLPRERRRTTRRLKLTVDVLTTIGMFVAIGLVIWRNWPAPAAPPIPLPAQPMAVADAPSKGSAAAPIAVVIYSDFECPYCGRFARDTMVALDRQYVTNGRVRFVYRHTTPPNHARALPSAIAAECARIQNRFWEMHDKLFLDQTKLDDASLGAHAASLSLDADAFKSCQADPTIARRIAQDAASARTLSIGGTPAFFIGTVRPDGQVKVARTLRGAVPLADFQEALDAELGNGSLAWMNRLRSPGAIAVAVAGGAALVTIAAWVRRRRLHAVVEDGRERSTENAGGRESADLEKPHERREG